MTTTDFARELKGFVDIAQRPPTALEWAVINAKLESCFDKVTPRYTENPPGTPISIGGVTVRTEVPEISGRSISYTC
jgi:hypothetical protein